MENFGKMAVFPGGYGRIGEIPHGRMRNKILLLIETLTLISANQNAPSCYMNSCCLYKHCLKLVFKGILR